MSKNSVSPLATAQRSLSRTSRPRCRRGHNLCQAVAAVLWPRGERHHKEKARVELRAPRKVHIRKPFARPANKPEQPLPRCTGFDLRSERSQVESGNVLSSCTAAVIFIAGIFLCCSIAYPRGGACGSRCIL